MKAHIIRGFQNTTTATTTARSAAFAAGASLFLMTFCPAPAAATTLGVGDIVRNDVRVENLMPLKGSALPGIAALHPFAEFLKGEYQVLSIDPSSQTTISGDIRNGGSLSITIFDALSTTEATGKNDRYDLTLNINDLALDASAVEGEAGAVYRTANYRLTAVDIGGVIDGVFFPDFREDFVQNGNLPFADHVLRVTLTESAVDDIFATVIAPFIFNQNLFSGSSHDSGAIALALASRDDGGDNGGDNGNGTEIPEPASAALLLAGIVGGRGLRRKKRPATCEHVG